MPFIPLYFIYFSITSFPLLSICSLYSGNWYKEYEHTEGEKFTLLDDSIISFEVQRGRKFYLKAVTYGDSLENTETKIVN
ncbi:hypothetical protein [Wolbachia endosymbiont (group B) of Hofmannophila pseudospretella]|uniref:hypothetical protein n=1 Tax=Wolbachia endosymbiont (group B) of Hofmannophila pseudospretella TaxID=3066177 RepID=UPI00333E5FA7